MKGIDPSIMKVRSSTASQNEVEFVKGYQRESSGKEGRRGVRWTQSFLELGRSWIFWWTRRLEDWEKALLQTGHT